MASTEVFRIEIPIETIDKYSSGLSKARSDVSKFEKEASKMQSRMERMKRQRWEMRIRAVDRASRVISSISSFANRVTSRTYRMTIRAIDMVTRPLRGIINGVTSTLGLLGATGGIAGGVVLPLKMKMDRQSITTAFEVLLGSAEKADQRITDLIEFAGKTPYTRDEIFKSSRVLEVFTKGALSTGKGLTMVGDIAAGTQQGFEDVALWIGRMYDAMSSGNKIGAMTSRLQEMGAIDGTQRARLEEIAEMPGDIVKKWKLAEREFQRFDGMMEKMSDNLANLLLGAKSFFMNNIIARWGDGLAKAITPALESFRTWRSENAEGIKEMGNAVERYGEKFTKFFVEHVKTGFSYVNSLFFSDEYKDLSFGAKIRMMVDDATNVFSDWWEKTGRDQVTSFSGSAGDFLGDMLNAGIMAALGANSDKGSPFATAGYEAGTSFASKFLEAFNAWEVTKTIASKVAEINIQGMTDPFKGEGFGSAAGAFITDALILGALSKILKPFKVLKKPMEWGGNVAKWGWNNTIGRTTKGGRDRASVTERRERGTRSQTTRRGAAREERRRQEAERQKTIFTPTWDSKSTRSAQNQKWWQKLFPFNKGGGGSRLLRRVPFLGAGLSLLSLGTATSEEIPGILGGIGGGLAGAKVGAIGGAALGSIVPGVGTAIGGAAGGIIGGIGGAIGGEQILTWLFGPKKASTAENVSERTVSNAEHPLASQYSMLPSNMNAEHSFRSLTEQSQVMSEAIVPLKERAQETSQALEELNSHLTEAAAGIAGSFIPLSELGEQINTNTSYLTEYLEQSARFVAETFLPLSHHGESLNGNLSNLSNRTLQAAGWISSISGVQSGAAAVRGALSNLASRIRNVNVPSIAGSVSTNKKARPYADGGYINQPHLGLVGEAGPEMIIPLSSGRRNRAMDLYQRTGQMLGVRAYADGGMVGKVPIETGPTLSSGINIIFGDIKTEVQAILEGQGETGELDLAGLGEKIADEVAGAIVRKAKEISSNMPMVRG